TCPAGPGAQRERELSASAKAYRKPERFSHHERQPAELSADSMAWADAGTHITQGRSNEDPLSRRHRAGGTAARRVRHLRLPRRHRRRLLLWPQLGFGLLRRAVWQRRLRQLRRRWLRLSARLLALRLLAAQLLRLALSVLRLLR